MTDGDQDPGRDGDEEQRKRDLHLWDRELGGYGHWAEGEPDPRDLPGPSPSRRTKTIYFLMMGTCVGLCVIAWLVVARFSTIAAVVMSAIALVIPPFAAMIANAGSATDRRRNLSAYPRGQLIRAGNGARYSAASGALGASVGDGRRPATARTSGRSAPPP